MTSLNIVQSKSQTEQVSSAIIDKLYRLALTSKVESNSSDFNMSLQGNISSYTAYRDAVDYLMSKFQNLIINVSSYYIRFSDNEFERICVANYSSDGIGCTDMDLASVNNIQENIFENNASLLDIDFSKFGTISNSLGYNLDGNVNLKHCYIKTCLGEIAPNRICCNGNGSMESLVIWSAKKLVGVRRNDNNSSLRILAVKTLTDPSVAIDGNTFSKLKVEDFYIGIDTPPTIDAGLRDYLGSYDNITHCIYVPIGSASAYRSASTWSNYIHDFQEYDFNTDPSGIFNPVK